LPDKQAPATANSKGQPPVPGINKYSNLVAAIATIASCDIALGFTFQLLPLLMESQKFPAWIIGLNTAMGPIGILLAGPILPRLISRIGPKRMAYGAVAFIMTALVVFKLTPSLYVWFPLRFLFGVATGALFTISEAWILTFAGAGNRGRIMGIYTSVMAISFSLGPFMLPFTGTDGWLPWIIGIICLGLGTLPLAFVDVSDDIFHDEEGGNFLRVVKRAPLLLFAVGTATLFDSVFISFFSIFGIRSGLTLQTASWLLGAGIIGNTLFQFLIGSLSDRWSRVGVVACSAGITVIMASSLMFVVHSWLIWPVVIILATSAFAVYVVALATMGDTFKGADLIAASAAFSAMWGVGGLIGPPIVGVAIDNFGINAMPISLAIIYVVLLIGLTLNGGRLIRGVQ
jgi:MFS family permease